MANSYKAFKGILQYKSTDTFSKESGYIYLIREYNGSEPTGNAEVWFGTRKYGDVNATKLTELQEQITANANNITAINDILGEWTTKFTGDISTVANAVIAVSADTKSIKDSYVSKFGGKTGDITVKGGVDTNGSVNLTMNENQLEASIVGLGTAAYTDESDYATAAQGTKADNALSKSDFETYSGNTNNTITSLTDDVKTLKGDVSTDGSVAKMVATAKSEVIGDATTDGNTLGKLEDRIETIVNDSKTYELKSITTGLATNVREAFGLFDNKGNQSGDTINIYKDSSLKNVELCGQTLQFTYILSGGTESVVGVDVSSFLSESEFGDGLQVIEHIVSVKKDATSEDFLSVTPNGIKLSGIQTAIETAVSSKNVGASGDTYISATASDNIVTIAATKKTTDAIALAETALQEGNITTGNDNGAINVNGTDVAVKGLGSAAYTDSDDYATKENFESHSGDTDIHITANERTTWNAKLDETTHESYTASTKTVLDDIERRLSSITDNAVTSVVSEGKTITITGDKELNIDVNTLDVDTAKNNGYIAIEKTSNGALYGVMYYGGNDAE